ncbi:large ribosomal subunit protein bL9m-like [Amphiura filiformis]|uniref:large ribosomal subunit protein bL9m-like n=1 Tax=Amphiura filiformis TaxID=82378 RepID=UPI003B2235D4
MSTKRPRLVGLQQQQTVFTLRRKYPAPPTKLYKSGKVDKGVKQRFKIYISDGIIRPKKLLKLILTENVEDLGVRGDIVLVPKRQGRAELLRYNKAVYASPENIEEFAKQDDGRDLPLTVSATLKYLENKRLQVDVTCLESDPHWEELSYPKARIINAFKNKLGVIVSEDALRLPEEPIKDYGTYTIQLTINGTETIPVEIDVVKNTITLDSNLEQEKAQ